MKRNLGFIIPLFLCFSLLTGFEPALHDPADPVSTTGSLYGFQDELQDDVLSDAPFELVTGKYEVSGIQRLVTDGYAARASGNPAVSVPCRALTPARAFTSIPRSSQGTVPPLCWTKLYSPKKDRSH